MNTSRLAVASFVAVAAMTFATDNTASAQYFNPVVDQFQTGGDYYDPFNNHRIINQHTTSIRESAFDSDRNDIDPGSYRYVDRYVYDQYGRRVREHGYQWTSNGRPHGKLTRTNVTHYPGSGFNPYPNTTVVNGSTQIYGTTQIQGSTQIHGGGHNHSGGHFYPRPSVTHQQSHTMTYGRQ